MKTFINPPRESWAELTQRPQLELGFLDSAVKNILNRVRRSGDTALKELTFQFDKIALENLAVTDTEIQEAIRALSPELKRAIETAYKNIETFHGSQRRETLHVETMPGVSCWRKPVPIDKVGIYIPGGTAPLFSTVLMLGTPAKLAGCHEVILCTPPDKHGKIHPAILFAANLVSVNKIFKVGGAQAIAAMAYGTESIPAVYKIFGPGNQYVTKAKQLVTEEGVAIDMPAGPSEVLIVADQSANPEYIAADLLSQAEHGEDSQVVLVLIGDALQTRVTQALKRQLDELPRKKIAEKALANSRVVIFNDEGTAISFINLYAPEHLIVNTTHPETISNQITNAGSVFLGDYSPEAVGDYASGTNHTLPTNGYAKAYAGVSLESFIKYVTFQKLSKEGLIRVGPVVEKMAEAEELIGHKRAISVRLADLNQKTPIT